jgi:di/tricarboxylate transporter
MARLAGEVRISPLAVVFLGAIVMTNLITNSAGAAFMFPIALAVATMLQVNFMPFVIIVMLGTSYAFINPAGYQTNLMVYAPGGYTFGDFARIGIPLTILVRHHRGRAGAAGLRVLIEVQHDEVSRAVLRTSD